MSINIDTHDILAGLLAGVLSVFLVIYAFQPNRPYPSWMLEPAEKPWIFVLIMLAVVFALKWDYLVGILLLLFVIAVVFDMIVFTRQIADNMDLDMPEPLFTPAINLIPSISTLKSQERFDDQKAEPQILAKTDQISKVWTKNLQPDPYELRHSEDVFNNDVKTQATISGKPLFDASIEVSPISYYPIFAPTQ